MFKLIDLVKQIHGQELNYCSGFCLTYITTDVLFSECPDDVIYECPDDVMYVYERFNLPWNQHSFKIVKRQVKKEIKGAGSHNVNKLLSK